MGVRLNKVLSELNIGLQTAVDFLKKKSELGEIKDDATSNTKISDEQYEALVNEFSTDKAVKTQAEQLFIKKPKEKKVEKPAAPEKAVTKSDELLEQRPQLKTLGKIDLDSVGKPKAAPVSEPVAAAEPQEEETPKEEEVVVVETPHKASEEVVEEPEQEEEVFDDVTDDDDNDEVEEEDAKAEDEPQAPTLAKTPGDFIKPATQLNVLGKIDLSTLNQSTRPKKKTKEERRKEREEKAAGERKKRERIRQGKVDIEAAAKQASQQGKNNKNGNNNNGKNNNNQQQNQQGGKKNKKNRPVKPLEVDDEAVARQVKETLARLTSKTNQNKKGAKYRKEKRDAVAERMNEEMAAEAAESKVLKLTEFVTVSELATMMNVGVNQVIGTCMSIGIMVSINQRLDAETINIVADEFGFTTEYVSAEVQNAIR